ncbi:MAG: hypothetical protein SNG59_07835 [Rikenellaceae bacterium]
MKKILLMATAALFAWSCTEEIDGSVAASAEATEVTIALSMGSNADTRVSLADNAEGGLTATWASFDDLNMWGEGATSTDVFSIQDYDGDYATFTGYISYSAGRAFLPVNYWGYTVSDSKASVSYASQTASAGSYSESGASMYMISDDFIDLVSDWTAGGTQTVTPSMLHIGSAIKIHAEFMAMPNNNIPEDAVISGITIGGGSGVELPVAGTIDLTEVEIDNVFEATTYGAIEVDVTDVALVEYDTYEFTVNSFPFDLAAGDTLEITFTLSGASNDYQIVTTIKPSSDWSLPRASFTTLTCYCDLGYATVVGGDVDDQGSQGDDNTDSDAKGYEVSITSSSTNAYLSFDIDSNVCDAVAIGTWVREATNTSQLEEDLYYLPSDVAGNSISWFRQITDSEPVLASLSGYTTLSPGTEYGLVAMAYKTTADGSYSEYVSSEIIYFATTDSDSSDVDTDVDADVEGCGLTLEIVSADSTNGISYMFTSNSTSATQYYYGFAKSAEVAIYGGVAEWIDATGWWNSNNPFAMNIQLDYTFSDTFYEYDTYEEITVGDYYMFVAVEWEGAISYVFVTVEEGDGPGSGSGPGTWSAR